MRNPGSERSELLAVDVGTLSARAGLFDATGALLSRASAPFDLHRPHEHHAVYRMDDIWSAVGEAARACLSESAIGGCHIAAVAFDATSSLYLDTGGESHPFDGVGDVVCWMDHRGEAEASEINATGHPFLRFLGGAISPEMHLPKLLWLKRHHPGLFRGVTAIRDLCDELAFRATRQPGHSICGLACKWPYLPGEPEPWRQDLLDGLGIGELSRVATLGHPARGVGTVHGRISKQGAGHLGVPVDTPIAVGLIDAEAGALGVLGAGFRRDMNRILPMIGGTSTNYMPFAAEPRHVPGVWGPFRDAVFAGHWMHEGGQSQSGAALDAVLDHHPASPGTPSPEAHAEAAAAVLAYLETEGPAFAAGRHIVPDWLGNRSPLGDGSVRALLTGIGTETGLRSFHETYYATARALALQSRHVAEHLNHHGFAFDRVHLSGGHLRNPLLVRLYRDALGRDLVVSDASEPVLLGTAMVAAVAAGLHGDLFDALDAMAPAQRTLPADTAWRDPHDLAYRVYLQLFAVRNDVAAAAGAFQSFSRPPWS